MSSARCILQSPICNLKSAQSLALRVPPSLPILLLLQHILRIPFRVSIRPSLPSTLGLFVRDTPEPTPRATTAATTWPSTEPAPRISRSYARRHTRPTVLRPRPDPAPGESFPGRWVASRRPKSRVLCNVPPLDRGWLANGLDFRVLFLPVLSSAVGCRPSAVGPSWTSASCRTAGASPPASCCSSLLQSRPRPPENG